MDEVSVPNDAEWISQWKEMKKFGDWLMQHGIICATAVNVTRRDDKIFEQRAGLTLVHQAAEILMKSYLVKENKEIRNGRRTSEGREMTIEFMESVTKINEVFHGKKLEYIDEVKFRRFNEIRNEIYHRSFKVPWEKDEEIQNFLREFKRFYERGFGEPLDTEDEESVERFRKIHSGSHSE